jgi:hypothetical protein
VSFVFDFSTKKIITLIFYPHKGVAIMSDQQRLEEMRKQTDRVAAEIAELKKKIERWSRQREESKTPPPKSKRDEQIR